MQNPYLDEDIQPLALTEGDIDDLAAFLASLTNADYKEQGVKELARQGEGLRPETTSAQAAPPVIKRGRRDSDSQPSGL